MRGWNNTEVDTTLLILGGMILAHVIVIGLFYIHLKDKDDDLLSPEMLMALIALPNTMISYAMGKRAGSKMNGNDDPNRDMHGGPQSIDKKKGETADD